MLNNASVSQSLYQKHLGIIILDTKLIFNEYLNIVSSKINETSGLLRKIRNLLPRSALITIYKVFVRPQFDHGDILYEQAYNMSFHQKLESVQCSACLDIAGAIRDTSKEQPFQKLDLELLKLRRSYKKLGIFYKIHKKESLINF